MASSTGKNCRLSFLGVPFESWIFASARLTVCLIGNLVADTSPTHVEIRWNQCYCESFWYSLDLLFDQILKKVDALCSNKQKQASFPGKKMVCGDNLQPIFHWLLRRFGSRKTHKTDILYIYYTALYHHVYPSCCIIDDWIKTFVGIIGIIGIRISYCRLSRNQHDYIASANRYHPSTKWDTAVSWGFGMLAAACKWAILRLNCWLGWCTRGIITQLTSTNNN